MTPSYFQMFADYNRWANRRLYAACEQLEEADYLADRPAAFFGSLHATLNHILVGDRLWLSRLKGEPESMALDTLLHEDFLALKVARGVFDDSIAGFMAGLTNQILQEDLHYKTVAGTECATPMHIVLAHFFNHQTHHRGQAHGLLSEAGSAPPPLDMIYFYREISA